MIVRNEEGSSCLMGRNQSTMDGKQLAVQEYGGLVPGGCESSFFSELALPVVLMSRWHKGKAHKSLVCQFRCSGNHWMRQIGDWKPALFPGSN